MWQGVAGGSFGAVTSDDASYSAEAKTPGGQSVERIANGVPGVEARLPLLCKLGVEAGRITLAQLVAAWSTGPARQFGLAPEKRSIAAGADADLVLIDPLTRRRMTAASLHGAIGNNPFDGMELTGWPATIIRRGEAAARPR